MATTDYSQYYKSALDEIKNKYTANRNALTEQQASVPAQYQQQRNLASQQANQSARQLQEIRAQQGYSRSPRLTNGIASIYGARDSAIGQANLGEQQARQSYMNRMNELNSEEATALQSMYGKQALDERQFAQQDYANRLNMMNALLNYNLGVGQVTDTLPQVQGFNYGDTLKGLLSQLYGTSPQTQTVVPTHTSTNLNRTTPKFSSTEEYKAWLKQLGLG